MEDLQAENARLRAELTEAQRIIRVARERLYDAHGRGEHHTYMVILAVGRILRTPIAPSVGHDAPGD